MSKIAECQDGSFTLTQGEACSILNALAKNLPYGKWPKHTLLVRDSEPRSHHGKDVRFSVRGAYTRGEPMEVIGEIVSDDRLIFWAEQSEHLKRTFACKLEFRPYIEALRAMTTVERSAWFLFRESGALRLFVFERGRGEANWHVVRLNSIMGKRDALRSAALKMLTALELTDANGHRVKLAGVEPVLTDA